MEQAVVRRSGRLAHKPSATTPALAAHTGLATKSGASAAAALEPATPSPCRRRQGVRRAGSATRFDSPAPGGPSGPHATASVPTVVPPGPSGVLLRTEACLQVAVEHICRVEPSLSSVFREHGLPVKLLLKQGSSAFHYLAKSIVSQQVSGKAAASIFSRLMLMCQGSAAAAGSAQAHAPSLSLSSMLPSSPVLAASATLGSAPVLPSSPVLSPSATLAASGVQPSSPAPVSLPATSSSPTPLVPSAALPFSPASASFGGTASSAASALLAPPAVLACSAEQLRSCGVSERKASYLHGLAQAFSDGTLSDAAMCNMSDPQLLDCLCKIKGIGPWTVDMFCMFFLGRPNVLPVGDLAVRKGVQGLYGLSKEPSPAEMQRLTAAWAPYRSVGSWCMWHLDASLKPPKQAKKQRNAA